MYVRIATCSRISTKLFQHYLWESDLIVDCFGDEHNLPGLRFAVFLPFVNVSDMIVQVPVERPWRIWLIWLKKSNPSNPIIISAQQTAYPFCWICYLFQHFLHSQVIHN